jgi:ADP-heptose:LPS heptosyltransferase
VGWRRSVLERFVAACSSVAPRARKPPVAPGKIFVLRNNDIGDLLVVTPLFEALKRAFPKAEVIAGIGSWNAEVLLGNPYVDRVVTINAPWYNHFVEPQTVLSALRFALLSSETKALRNLRIDVGIDVLGSGFGSLLMICACIPYRLGVRGYAGGESAVQAAVDYRPDIHVGRQALRFAEILGCSDLPENRPQIYLEKPVESHGAIVIAPGTGNPSKAWPPDHFVNLGSLLRDQEIVVIGSADNQALAERISRAHGKTRNVVGQLSLRESFALIAGAKLVVCNSSMPMHVAAAFRRPCVTLLGEAVESASLHHRQWGYPETVMLGRDESHRRIVTADEACAKIRVLLSNL